MFPMPSRELMEIDIGTEVYIYALVDPLTAEVRYVGRANDLHRRMYAHIYNAKHGQKSYKANWIRKVLASGKRPEILIIETCNENNWRAAETFWIASLRAAGFRLTNNSDGGECGPRWDLLPEEVRKKQADNVSRSMRLYHKRHGRAGDKFGILCGVCGKSIHSYCETICKRCQKEYANNSPRGEWPEWMRYCESRERKRRYWRKRDKKTEIQVGDLRWSTQTEDSILNRLYES